MKNEAARKLFDSMHPDYFSRPSIRGMEKDETYEELTLALDGFSCDALTIPVPEGITFGLYDGDMDALRERVRLVDAGWVQYYDQMENVLCAYDGGQVVSFCLLDDMGEHELDGRKIKVAGPGCVGTVPDSRKKGIGLRLVQLATQILKERGYDLSYIHYTGVGPWYAKLGYKTLLCWNRSGIIAQE